MKSRTGISLHWNFSWSLLASVVAAASQWLVIAALARWFPPRALGQYTYALAVVAPIVLVGQLNLRLMQTVDQRGEYMLADYYSARLIGTLVSAVLLGIYLLVDPVAGSSVMLIMLIALARFAEGMGDIAHGRFLQAERADLQARSLVLRSALQLAVVAAVAILVPDVLLLGAGILAASLVAVALFDVPHAGRFESAFSDRPGVGARTSRMGRCVAILRKALPLGAMGVLGSLYQNIPRYEIGLRDGVEAVGSFSAIFYFTFAGYVVVSAIGGSISPRISRAYVAGRHEFRSFVLAVSAAAALVGLGGVGLAMLCGDRILAATYGSDYAKFQDVFVWIMVSSVFWYASTALSFCAIAAGKFRGQLGAHVLAVVVTWVMSRYLVGSHGLSGGAMALTCGVLALFVVQVWIVRGVMCAMSRDPS